MSCLEMVAADFLLKTGVFEYSPDVKAEQRSENASWAYTVYDNATRFSASWWYNTGGANYTDDFGM